MRRNLSWHPDMSPKHVFEQPHDPIALARSLLRAVVIHLDAFTAFNPSKILDGRQAIALRTSSENDVILSVLRAPDNWAGDRGALGVGSEQRVAVEYEELISLSGLEDEALRHAYALVINESMEKKASEVFARARSALQKRKLASVRAREAIQAHKQVHSEAQTALKRSSDLLELIAK